MESIIVALAAGAAVQVDGDYWGETPVALELEPGVVPILVPPGAGADAAPGRGGARS